MTRHTSYRPPLQQYLFMVVSRPTKIDLFRGE